MLEMSLRKKHPVISFIWQRDFTPRLIEIKGNQLNFNNVCIPRNNGHLLPARPVNLLIKTNKNKNLYVKKKKSYINVHTIKDGAFNHARLALCYDVRQILNDKNSGPPPTIKCNVFVFDLDFPKEHYI